MLSHLRLHRRAPSNPTSPIPPDQPSPNPLDQHQRHQQNDASAASPVDQMPPSSSASSAFPPTLPPITRVTSEANIDLDFQNVGAHQTQYAHQHQSPSSAHPTPQRSPYTEHTGFIGGVALQNYRRGLQAGGQSGPISLGNSALNSPVAPTSEHDSRSPINRPSPSPISATAPSKSTPAPQQRQGQLAPSFVTPTDLQNAQSAAAGGSSKATGKRPAGARISTEPGMSLTVPSLDTPKPKKGLPFLKNPMSTLLMRRKSSQPVPDIVPLPLGSRKDDAPNDPSIRGTKVHDFSLPRSKRIVSSISPSAASYGGQQQQHPGRQQSCETLPLSPQPSSQNQAYSNLPDSKPDNAQPTEDKPRSKSTVSNSSQHVTRSRDSIDPSGVPHPLSLERKPVPGKPLPPVPPKDKPASIDSRPSTISKTASVDTISVLPRPTPSNRTTKSRNVSFSERSVRDFSGSSVPKHMKSTSSRFSFDMIGAAKQEKLLEERHRQREQEKGTTEPSDRDSRFDDFDDDGFDYDAMDYDDGLEEPIPGVNADYEDEDDGFFEEPIPGINADIIEEEEEGDVVDDPDDDQENFAGFVFQRSNPASTLASPLCPNMVTTPRDAEGKVIGFAMTKDATTNPNMLSPVVIPDTPPKSPDNVDTPALGIPDQSTGKEDKPPEPEATLETETQTAMPAPPAPAVPVPRHLDPSDELYFDNGLREFEGENIDDGEEPFDESLFDLQDTDQYGRPLPGVFAQAQSMRLSQRKKQRESDGTSRFSGASGASESSAHTSLDSVVPAPIATAESSAAKPTQNDEMEVEHEGPAEKTAISASQEVQVAAYQAALAAAAYQAAASGKFRRDSSPPLAEVTITSPTTTTSSQHDMAHIDEFGDDDDGFGNDMDDYEFDDDAMVAEANASVLANDSDGFYGQEFGFYSAPVTQPPTHHVAAPGPGPVAGASGVLSAENLFQYANGGYFGPSGVNRTTSGRVVSREPNLTPITERSEYSNRNSVMSGMGIPPMGGSNPLSSPGLAQLAALASEDGDDETMSLSALLRLRSRAWGGSQASLVSSRDGSPRSETGREGAMSPWGTGSGLIGVGGGATPASANAAGLPSMHARNGSNAFSIMSRDSEPGSRSASPTLTMTMPLYQQQQLPPTSQPRSTSPPATVSNTMSPPLAFSPQQQQPTSFFPPVVEDDEPPSDFHAQMRSPDVISEPFKVTVPTLSQPHPGSIGAVGLRRGSTPCHRKRGSQDSISYMKEKEEESGETRWVIERRRTAESGEVEILGREVLESGRI